MFSKIQNKIILAFVSLTVLLTVIVLLIITQATKSNLVEKVKTDFKHSQSIFVQIQKLNYQRQVETAIITTQQPKFKGTISLSNDPNSNPEQVHNSVLVFEQTELAPLVNSDLFIVTDKKGNLLANMSQPTAYGKSLADQPAIAKVLNGEIPDPNPESIDLWEMDNKLYQVVTVPTMSIAGGAPILLGTLTLGSQINQSDAENLKSITGFDVTFLFGDKIIGSTLNSYDQEALVQKIETIIQGDQRMELSRVHQFDLQSGEFFNLIDHIGNLPSAWYVISTPESIQLSILNRLQSIIYITGIAAILLSVILAFFFSRTITRPILKLAAGVKRIKSGEFDVKIQSDIQDEIGQLTRDFNEMSKGLQERFQLLKYVGEHTKAVIGDAGFAESVKREHLTVLFSDIRGFTAFSEDRDPEIVVEMLNKYLSVQANLVTKYGGSVDKFVGDEMVAIFQNSLHSEQAVDCALEIIEETRKLNTDSIDIPIAVGIGINTGPVVMGNMGSENRKDYTVIGANMNLGARLCGAAKPYQILITENTLKNVIKKYKTQKMEPIKLKGISRQVDIYEVLT